MMRHERDLSPPEGIPFRTNNKDSMPPSSRSSINVDTPTYTATTDGSTDRLAHQKTDTPPYSGRTYVIRERNSGHLITLVNGELRLEKCTGEQGGWHWCCEERQGWLGFRNPVSGTYIGHDSQKAFWAKYNHHKTHEYFCARKHPKGGYLLLIRQGDELHKVAISEKKACTLVMTTSEGTLWDFDEVPSSR